mgnify:FL=1
MITKDKEVIFSGKEDSPTKPEVSKANINGTFSINTSDASVGLGNDDESA